MYNTTAFLYESTAAFEVPATTCDDIHRLLVEGGRQPPGLIGDLGSGTGLISVLLAQKGWQVYGIELSNAMLAQAAQKTASLPPAIQQRLTWVQGNIANFKTPNGAQWDAAVCLCNTINHLSDWSLVESFIHSVYQALKPQGLLILDSDTIDTFKGYFHHGPVTVWDDGRHRMTRACNFDPLTGLAQHLATLEEYIDGALQWLSEESMTLRYHPETKLYEAFLAAGFQLEKAEPYNPFPKLYRGFVPKLLWVLRKAG